MEKRPARDANVLERLAERAEQDAVGAMDFAIAAYEGAVYEVLTAVQIRLDADFALRCSSRSPTRK